MHEYQLSTKQYVNLKVPRQAIESNSRQLHSHFLPVNARVSQSSIEEAKCEDAHDMDFVHSSSARMYVIKPPQISKVVSGHDTSNISHKKKENTLHSRNERSIAMSPDKANMSYWVKERGTVEETTAHDPWRSMTCLKQFCTSYRTVHLWRVYSKH